jgi:hypothetical protein
MRTLRTALVGGFAGALMAGNVATLHAAPLPTNMASMKLGRLFHTGLVRRLARRGRHKCAECLEGGAAPADEHQLATGAVPLSEVRLSPRKAAGRTIGS